MTNTTTTTRQRTDTNGIALIDHALALSNDDDHPAGLIWGLRAVHPDLRSRNGFRWGWPGTWTSASDKTCDKRLVVDHRGDETGICSANTSAYPRHEGDGLCVAKTWGGIALGGIRATTLLVVGWRPEDLLGEDDEKVRVRRAYVRDVIDGARLVREHGSHADLSGADLSGADLSGAELAHADLTCMDLSHADLSYADLSYANLSGTKLWGADLWGADLTEANLSCANLSGAIISDANLPDANLSFANLSGAWLPQVNLSDANLREASLWNANLSGAYLADANLSCANLLRANLSDADLSGADLRDADLRDAALWDVNLRGAKHNVRTRWPEGWNTDRIAQEVNR